MVFGFEVPKRECHEKSRNFKATTLALDFVFAFLFAVGSPVAAGVTMFIDDRIPNAEPILNDALFQWLVTILMALLLLYHDRVGRRGGTGKFQYHAWAAAFSLT